MGKAFEKQIKAIEDKGQKQIDALKSLKPKEETKPIEDKPNNQSRAAIIFNELINKRKDLMKKLHDEVDYKSLNFKYVDKKNDDVSFYGYKNSKDLFNIIKSNQIDFDDALKRQNKFLNKLNNIKIGNRNLEQKKSVNNLEKFYISREEVFNFFRDYWKMILDAAHKSNENKTEGKELKILTPKQMLQRLPIALA